MHYHIIFSGDDTQTWGPPFMKSESVYFMSVCGSNARNVAK